MLLDKLINKQAELKLSDSEFAKKLGVSRSLWGLTRTRKFRISEKVLRGAVRAFPDLQPDVLIFLQSNASEFEDKAS